MSLKKGRPGEFLRALTNLLKRERSVDEIADDLKIPREHCRVYMRYHKITPICARIEYRNGREVSVKIYLVGDK